MRNKKGKAERNEVVFSLKIILSSNRNEVKAIESSEFPSSQFRNRWSVRKWKTFIVPGYKLGRK